MNAILGVAAGAGWAGEGLDDVEPGVGVLALDLERGVGAVDALDGQ